MLMAALCPEGIQWSKSEESDRPTKGRVLSFLYKMVKAIVVRGVVEGLYSSALALLAKIKDILDN